MSDIKNMLDELESCWCLDLEPNNPRCPVLESRAKQLVQEARKVLHVLTEESVRVLSDKVALRTEQREFVATAEKAMTELDKQAADLAHEIAKKVEKLYKRRMWTMLIVLMSAFAIGTIIGFILLH